MMNDSSRKGSAILIVLGMLSFMVVSAVGFAVYMRQSRMPSSYLRRTTSTRYLLKAALANAIDRIDGSKGTDAYGQMRLEGIYDDPYPGVGRKENEGDPDHRRDGDFWRSRVFTPFGMVSPESTVSTLTLEGLAYLPPAIINEARVYSRTTRTARWKNLAYDMGRYAFSAFDVSDCFDINKLFAGERRTSAPGKRVNLSSLFPNNGSQLDSILEKWESSDIPFVSLADFNIAAENSPFAPWYRYVSGSGGNVGIYNNGDYQTVSNALFVTDTWFPPTNTAASASTRIDLASKRPFTNMNQRNFVDIDENGNKLYTLLMKNIGGAGLACLYDYLDKDRKPLSLALPTVETQPMVCGVSADFAAPPAFKDAVTTKEGTATFKQGGVDFTVTRKITGHKLEVPSVDVMVSGVATFPFKRISGNRKGSWRVEALTALFFATDDLQARVMKNSVLKPKKDYWNGSTPNASEAGGVIWSKVQGKELSFADNIQKTDDAVKLLGPIQLQLKKATFPLYYEISEKVTKTDPQTMQETVVDEWSGITTDQTRNEDDGALMVYKANGDIADIWNTYYKTGYKDKVWIEPQDLENAAKRGKESQHLVELNNGTKFRPYLAVWVRVKDGNDVVDLVPATCDDDKDQLQGVDYSGLESEIYKMCGSGAPLLDFRLDHEFSFSVGEGGSGFSGLTEQSPVQRVGWKSLYAPDPRYNFAPEDWFGTTDDDTDPAKWKEYAKQYLGQNGRDKDIFMFTSDQEYLQSIGELAFLPYVQDMNGNASFFEGNFMNAGRYHGRNDFSARTPGNDQGFANGWRFWRTYTAYDLPGRGYDPIYELRDGGTRYEIVSGTGDFRVNPFSPDTRVLMAALKDTPYDWSVASTNRQTNTKVDLPPTARAQWAFCEGSSIADLGDEELEDVAARMRDEFYNAAKNGDANWEEIYDTLRWHDTNNRTGDEQKTILGIAEDFDQPLHGVDRKYLHAFWRECFQNRQQLFLVFIRAEALAVGASGSGSLGSSQLGARGVALVWRDPNPPSRGRSQRKQRSQMTTNKEWENYYQNCAPHRTRVLFYHQFD